jgi:DNA-binding response OmpR family regulator
LQYAKTNDYGALILDLMLPDIEGVALCRRLRSESKKGSSLPILVLTARDEIDKKVEALNSGADDYLTKPFSFEELSARIRALLRRPTDKFVVNPMLAGDIILDTVTRTVKRQDKDVRLCRKEFNLLEYLMRCQGRVVTRSMILDNVWGTDVDPLSNTVDVHINYLREKLDKPFANQVIKTVPGLGYKLEV